MKDGGQVELVDHLSGGYIIQLPLSMIKL